MNAGKEIFSTKLRELEQEHERIRSRLRLCQQEDRRQVRQELDCLTREIDETDARLQKGGGRQSLPAVAALSAAQMEYERRMQAILREKLPRYLHCAATDTASDRAEAAALYAEYAMDFAAQAMRRALQSALAAVELQLELEEKEGCRHMKRIPRPLAAAASLLAGRVLWRLLRRNQQKNGGTVQ